MADTALERIRSVLAGLQGDEVPARFRRPLALGWATVDTDRATRELAAQLGFAADAFQPAPDSLALGARCVVAHDALVEGHRLVVLEPFTEGRLAASLARDDEGPTALWLVAADVVDVAGAEVPDGGASTAGPFGPERLVLVGPVGRVRWFLIGSWPGTIDT